MAVVETRRMRDKYSYFIRGRKLVLLEWKDVISTTMDESYPDYQAPSSSGDSLTGANAGKTGISSGLLLQFTAIPDTDELLTENDLVPVNDILALAMVDYIKAQLVEDPRDQAKQVYYMQRFKEKIAKYANKKVGGIRRVVGTEFMRDE
jgi:hypothetical protein